MRMRSTLSLLAVALTACASVGPDYVPPEPEKHAPKEPLAAATSPVASRAGIVSGAPVTSDWWLTLGDAQLVGLITSAVDANLDLQLATSRVREARAARGIAEGAFLPQVGVGTANGKVQGENGEGMQYGLTTASFEASWEIDVFGGLRRNLEAATADVQALEEARRASLVSLLGEVGRNYCELRGAQRRLAVARENVELQSETVEVITSRQDTGLVSDLELAQARTQLELTRSLIPRLESSVAKSIFRLSVLLGREPDALLAQLATPAPIPLVPPTIPVGLPSQLLQRRPDIRLAEREMAAASARLGVATADLYPKFGLTASISAQSLWAGPTVTWPIFAGGQIVNNIKVADERLAQSLIRFRSVILLALEDVESSITAFSQEQVRRDMLFLSVEQADRAVAAARTQYELGMTALVDLIVAQQARTTASALLAESEQTLLTNLIAVYKALGGGWDRFDPQGTKEEVPD